MNFARKNFEARLNCNYYSLRDIRKHRCNKTETSEAQLVIEFCVPEEISNISAGSSKHRFEKREQYLFNVFEVIVSTLESKLQRIENLDKAVEHLMRRVEMLDSRVTDNIDKTDSVIAKLRTLDLKLFHQDEENVHEPTAQGSVGTPRAAPAPSPSEVDTLDMRLVSLDQKVSDIDTKLIGLKNQLDTNFLPADDINAEASEKKPISMNVVDITKVLNAEVMTHVSRELEGLKTATGNVDRKLQFHINLVSENLGKVLNLVTDVHEAVVEAENPQVLPQIFRNKTTVAASKNSKLDTLVKHMHPILSVSEKMDEVWDVVVGTKSSVDDLVPKSDELLTQTQRQERAISDIHADLRTKANKIIANLDLVEKRLKKQEDDVATLAQRPVPAELLLDPTIDRLVEYDPNRYSVVIPQDEMVTITEPPTQPPSPPVSYTTPGSTSNHVSQGTTIFSSSSSSTSTPSPTTTSTTGSNTRGTTRSRGVIFPSVKNKPSPANTTFTTDLIANIKDVKITIALQIQLFSRAPMSLSRLVSTTTIIYQTLDKPRETPATPDDRTDAEQTHWFFNDAASTIELFTVDRLRNGKIVFDEMRARIHRVLPDIALRLRKPLKKSQPGNQQKRESSQRRAQLRISRQTR
ncbi:hypothetical protein ANN_21872 [Periplaneta americana]|uniref:Uncharacterized protein n=1 Tax=Periplaneta americana TaxID=6978 RepID=A0ABQ8S6K4_PERAM|nr:hypothetical protein ANN_21872 [Periplaneta americana]